MTVVNEQMTLASLYGPCTRMGEKERGLKRSSAPLGLVVTTKVSALMKKLISGDGQKKGCQGVRCCLEDACYFQNISPLKFPTLSKEKCIAFFYLVCLHIHDHAYQGTCVDVKGQLVTFIHNMGLGEQTQVSVA